MQHLILISDVNLHAIVPNVDRDVPSSAGLAIVGVEDVGKDSVMGLAVQMAMEIDAHHNTFGRSSGVESGIPLSDSMTIHSPATLERVA